MEATASHPQGTNPAQATALLTLPEIAGYLSVPLAVVEGLAAERAFPVLRIGTERRVRREALEAFLRRSEE